MASSVRRPTRSVKGADHVDRCRYRFHPMSNEPAAPEHPPAISFAIPYYRNRGYLEETIGSVLAQTIDDWELTVVDDAGPEPAHEIVEALGDARVRYLRNSVN